MAVVETLTPIIQERLKPLLARRDQLLDHLATCEVRDIAYLYFPAVFGIGVLLGVLMALVSALIALLFILFAGVGIGYGIRAFISYQRRMRARREWQ